MRCRQICTCKIVVFNTLFTQPVGRNGTTVTIGWSNPGGLDCVNSVEATPAESVAMQRTVSLDCTYNGTSPVFCVNFTSPVGCPSTSGVNNDTAGKRFPRARRFILLMCFPPIVICRSPSTGMYILMLVLL